MTRGRALVAAALLAGAVLAPAASAQSSAAITLSPASAPAGTTGTWSITVAGAGFAANTKVDVTFAGALAGSVAANGQGAFSLPIAPARRAGGTYTVVATQTVCGVSCFNVTASASFLSVPPMRAYDQPSFAATGEEQCGPSGPGFNWSVHVSGSLWQAGVTGQNNIVTVVFYRLETVITRIQATVASDGTWQVNGWAVPAQPEAPAGTYSVRASDQRGASARLEWNVPCRPPDTTTSSSSSSSSTSSSTRPTTSSTGSSSTLPTTTTTVPPTVPGVAVLSCSPCLGPPGFVTQLNGSGYPANAGVTLRWLPGLGEKAVTADGAGSFSTQMLVMPGDAPGLRQAVGEVGGGGPSATAAFLVVPSTVTPSGRDVAQLVRLTQLVHR